MYQVTVDEEGSQFIGFTLDCDYEDKVVHVSMPGYVQKAFRKMMVSFPYTIPSKIDTSKIHTTQEPNPPQPYHTYSTSHTQQKDFSQGFSS